MKLFTPKFRITLGLVGVLTSLVMLAFFLSIIPNRDSAVREGRTALAESIAVYSTALVTSAKKQRMIDDFSLLVERNQDLLSLGLRHERDGLIVFTGDHADQWEEMTGEYSKDAQVRVPIWAGDHKWGQLELRFKPLELQGIWGLIKMPMLQTAMFIGLLAFLLYYYYLGKVLRQLDPSQAIPGRVRAALDTMAEGLLILDRKEQIVLANEAFAAMIAMSPDDLIGYLAGELPWLDKDGNQIAKPQRPWVQAIQNGRVQKDNTIRLQLPNNALRTFKTNCSPVLGDGGKYAGVLVSFNDITELEEKEVELLNSKLEAEEANKAKSAFLANMSHEIRTPMNAILGFTEILKRGYVKNEKESLKYLNTIHSSGKNLLELINDILDLSKVESGRQEVEKRKVEPYTTIHEVLHMLAVKANEKGLQLNFKAEGALPAEIETDPVRLRQIAFNLIGNAIKFTEEGRVSIICRYQASKENPQLIIDIADTGIGMPEDTLENIFNPFVQADSSVTRRFGGTGLGLAISRRFAQALGGDIFVKSEVDKGSTFRVCLATGSLKGVALLEPEEVQRLQTKIDAEGNYRWQFPQARVLVVDDGVENRELVKFLLEEAGLTVKEAENGQQGVEKAAAGKFDVILMDVQMPVMDGFTAAGLLRKQGLKIPIIALTANAMKGFEAQCIKAGYSGYLSKPINIDRFMALMAKLLGGQKVENTAGASEASEISTDTQPKTQSAANLNPIVSKLPTHIKKFRNIIANFVKRLASQLAAMQKALDGADYTAVAELAHWLKGAGGTVGFDVLSQHAARLETHAKNQNAPKIKAEIATLQQLAARIVVPGNAGTGGSSSAQPPETTLKPISSPSQHQPDPGVTKPIVSRLAKIKRLQPTILSFVQKLDEKVQGMERALQKEDMQELASLAHWLKGAGGTVGYDDLTKPAADLESSAKAVHVKMANERLKKLKALVAAIVPPEMETKTVPKAKKVSKMSA